MRYFSQNYSDIYEDKKNFLLQQIINCKVFWCTDAINVHLFNDFWMYFFVNFSWTVLGQNQLRGGFIECLWFAFQLSSDEFYNYWWESHCLNFHLTKSLALCFLSFHLMMTGLPNVTIEPDYLRQMLRTVIHIAMTTRVAMAAQITRFTSVCIWTNFHGTQFKWITWFTSHPYL